MFLELIFFDSGENEKHRATLLFHLADPDYYCITVELSKSHRFCCVYIHALPSCFGENQTGKFIPGGRVLFYHPVWCDILITIRSDRIVQHTSASN